MGIRATDVIAALAGQGWVSAGTLALALGITARQLRRVGNVIGPIERLNPEILQSTGKIVISNTAKGYKLTGDRDEIKHAKAQLMAHSIHQMERAHMLNNLLVEMSNSNQERMAI